MVSIVLPDFEIIKLVYFFLLKFFFDCKLSMNSKLFLTVFPKN